MNVVVEFIRLLIFLTQVALQVAIACCKALVWLFINVVVPGLTALWSALVRGTVQAAAWWNQRSLAAQSKPPFQPPPNLMASGHQLPPPAPTGPGEPPYIGHLRAQGQYPYYVMNGDRSGWWVANTQFWPDYIETFRGRGYYFYYHVDGVLSAWNISTKAPWLDYEQHGQPALPFVSPQDARPV